MTQQNSTARSRLDFIDGLRGLAILLVLLRHYYMHIYTPGLPRLADVLGLGYLGVHLFLLLSGFCVTWTYIGPRRREFDLADFFRRRATRIIPAYYAALGIALLLSLPHSTRELLWQGVTHVTMMHNLFPSTVLALNGPFWSLALESQLYIIFPLLLASYRRWGTVVTLGFIFIFQTAFRLYALRYGTDYNNLTFILPWSMAGRLLEFALGMWVATVVADAAECPVPPRWYKMLPVPMLAAFATALAAKSYLGVSHPVTDFLWMGGFTCLLLAASNRRSILCRIFSWRPLGTLGIISYSVYLVHEMLLGPVARVVLASTGNMMNALLLLPAALGVTVACCYIFYRCIEKPGSEFFSRRRSTSPRVPDVASPASIP